MAVKLNSKAFSHAKSLINSGEYVYDKNGDWKAPGAEQENSYIEKNGYAEFGKWYLGIDTDADKETKGHYKFPFTKDFEKIYRSGVIAIKVRAAQNGYQDIVDAADTLLVQMDKKEGVEEKKQSEHLFYSFAEKEGENKDVLILITGKFQHPLYGDFEITEENFKESIANFSRLGEIPVDVNHAIDYPEPEKAKARGWIKQLYIKEIDDAVMQEYNITDKRAKGRMGLFGKVEWLDEAREAISKGEFKFLSAGFILDDKDKMTGKDIGMRLQHVSLTNVPFLKGLIGEVKLTDAPAWWTFAESVEILQGGDIVNEKILKLFDAKDENELLEKAGKVLKEKEELEKKVAEFEKSVKELAEIAGEKEELEKKVKELDKQLKIEKLLREGKILEGDVEYVKKLMQYDESLVEEFVKKREVTTTQFSGAGENKIEGNNKEEIATLAENWAKENNLDVSGWEALKLYFREYPEMEEKYFGMKE